MKETNKNQLKNNARLHSGGTPWRPMSAAFRVPIADGDPAKSGPGSQSQAGVGGSCVPSGNQFSVSASTFFLSTLWSRDWRRHPVGAVGEGGGRASADMAPSGRVSPQ